MGRTKGLLDFLMEGNILIIERESGEKINITSANDLSGFFSKTDSSIILADDACFKEYFK